MASPSDIAPTESSQATILIVDDLPDNITLLTDVLSPFYQTRFALNGEKALKIANNKPRPDLILLDIMMPGISGYDVCQRLKSNSETCDIPVIFVTAMNEMENEQKGLELGAIDYITKPINAPIVLARVRTHLALASEKAKVDRLLLNILPKQIAERLKHGETNISEHFDQVAILFADLVGFTQVCSEMSSRQIVTILNEIFCAFDTKADALGLEKIKTIGDGYMAMAGGLSTHTADLLKALELGHFMIQFIDAFNRKRGLAFSVRVGVHVGSVTAGVIGKTKFAYDIWGDTVNIASRMESTGTPMHIQISETMANCLPDKSVLGSRAEVEVKGRGKINTWLLKRTDGLLDLEDFVGCLSLDSP
jgi:adenylate cyclase